MSFNKASNEIILLYGETTQFYRYAKLVGINIRLTGGGGVAGGVCDGRGGGAAGALRRSE